MKNLAKIMKELTHYRDKIQYQVLNQDSEYLERKGSSYRSLRRGLPEGYFAVYVGDQRKRYVVPTDYLSHPIFLMLLDKAHEEFGFKQKEALALPCDVDVFEHLMSLIQSNRSGPEKFDLEKLMSNLSVKCRSVPDE